MLRAFVNCAKTVLPALAMSQRLNFLISQLPKAEQRPLRTCQLVANWQIKNQGGALLL
jgi:hypothetical protein